ncbi:hypothetical protein H8B02_22760 [Bradyrhizobium sp. Pear77]|uniref:hypothetical protein n=1 Tax=Bradyrhizobium altum TaxID=1571202 RepID=UPI001E58B544|nr:hypothetical protein [Bradyrhizobium altum]MCC8956147.1 hypothetical protein [Bradyrhizobium altum]
MQLDTAGRYRETTTLPKESILNPSERAEVQRYMVELDGYLRLDQPVEYRDAVLNNNAAIAAMIAALLLKGGRKLDKEESDAATEDYLDAIEDLPAWAVREAIRRWNRAESSRLDGKPHNYDFRPSPPTLRRLALHAITPLRGRMLELQKLLNAEELIEYSDEHRKRMLERLADVVKPRVISLEKGEAA